MYSRFALSMVASLAAAQQNSLIEHKMSHNWQINLD
jgi:hypothetical protein